MIPILIELRDPSSIVGFIKIKDEQVLFQFNDDAEITHEMMFQIFGNVGFTISKSKLKEGILLIKSGRFHEWAIN